MRQLLGTLLVVIAGCGGGGATPGTDAAVPLGDAGPATSLGTTHDGQYNLGPVEWSEGTWHNAFGEGPFTLTVVAVDGTRFSQTFPSFTPGALVAADGNL